MVILGSNRTIQGGAVKEPFGRSCRSRWGLFVYFPVDVEIFEEGAFGDLKLDECFFVVDDGLEFLGRSEERRVGKECRSRRSPYHYKQKVSTTP